MSNYRVFRVDFKRRVAEEFLAGASLNALSRKHEVARNLIRIWVAKS
jgi:transposase